MIDPTTRRAEEIRETTNLSWEASCLRAERERDAGWRENVPLDELRERFAVPQEGEQVPAPAKRHPNRVCSHDDAGIVVSRREARAARPYVFGCE
jgi:hypothetical protein